MTTPLRISVLGPVRAWRADEELDLGTPQQRAVLATLVLREGRQATLEALIDAVWGDDPPRTSALTLRTYVSRLRQVLGADVIVTAGGGYLLRLEPGTLDLADFTAAVAQARASRDPGEAAQLLHEAESLWQGPALADVPGSYAAAQRVRLERERQTASEERLALDVASDRAGVAVTELTALVEEHPLDENLSGLYMLGLSRTGRQAAAIAEYGRIRDLLADELGLDPGAALRDIHQRILVGELSPVLQAAGSLAAGSLAAGSQRPAAVLPAGGMPAPAVVGPAAGVLVPEQLPLGNRDFVGRAALLDQLAELLVTPGVSAPVVGLVGLGGMGTSTVAIHLAHRVRPSYPDGQLYADLRAGGDAGVVLTGFLRSFGVPATEVPDALSERAALWRTVSCGRRLLIMLDHVATAEQLRLLLPAGTGSAAIITGSRRIPDLPVTQWVTLPAFEPEESVELFRRIAGRDRVNTEHDAALRFAAACSHLPLAVRLGAERLAARPTWSVASIGERLRVEMRQPVALHEDCIRVEAPFERDLALLRAADPLAAVAFGLVALPEAEEITAAAAARLLDLPETEAERLMESLVDAHLVEPAGYQRYRYHEIVRWFARRKAIAAHSQAYRDAVLARLGESAESTLPKRALRAV
ncbi:DNA-binding SARP family transcriptional activator [Actinoplanes lutulentus]|uniref:DNA-binding SARP family transcriptional activator n=1 Tax=Actinoplanes lutulentus TaxID=1287878 RepID=A0A327ZAE5_9ACTN|nr:BTAD domain-containing putative transcriptional regulator [Actinoplanes lutulentus]MBB2947194.1 DNA-binding SARP family transcriptional activator [Actinoplanes lutulentus]RAK36469.1 DNA-binding SARP family transcriptional activator [Actinoplanes lutulentus]